MNLSKKSTIDILYLMFIAMSILFWKERIINQDTSFYSFIITAFERFNIEHHRYIAAITQVIPITLAKLHFSLKTVLIWYSVSLALLPYLFFRVVLYSLNDKFIAWAMLLSQILLCSHYFFDGVSESKSTFALVLLSFAIFKNKATFSNLNRYYLYLVLVVLAAIISHPLSILLFGVGICWLGQYRNNLKQILILSSIVIITVSLKMLLLPSSGYETGLMSKLFEAGNWENLFANNYAFDFAKSRMGQVYLMGIVLFLFFLYRYVRDGKHTIAALYAGINFVLFLFLITVFKEGENEMMMEKNLATQSMAILLPLLTLSLPELNQRDVFRFRVLLPILCLVLFIKIKNTASFYQNRHEQLTEVIESVKLSAHQKYFISKSDLEHKPNINIWTLPMETTLLSALKGPYNVVTVKNIENVEHWRGIHKNKHSFIGPDFRMPYDTRKFKSNFYLFNDQEYILLEVNR